MKKINKSWLILILGLVIGGAFIYFISNSQGNSTPASDISFTQKQQCANATTNLLLRLNQGYGPDNQLVALNSIYNKSLNTCLALVSWKNNIDGGYDTEIFDTLSGKNLAVKTTTGSTAIVPNVQNAAPADFDRYQASLGL